MKKNSPSKNMSGVVVLEEDVIKWMYDGELLLSIKLADIAVIGEYTTAAGPWMDDWFIVFVKKDATFYQIPFYAEGREELIHFLNAELVPNPFIGMLVNSTRWTSIVNYPDAIKAKPLFQLRSAGEYGYLERIVRKALISLGIGESEEEILLSEEVKNYLAV
jgi:hypothetical protein